MTEEEHDAGQAPSAPPLDEMSDVTSPLPSQLPPTPSPNIDIDMEQHDPDEDGPPPGWDNSHQLEEKVEQLLIPAAASEVSPDIKMDDVHQDARNEEGPEPRSEAHPSPAPELVPLDIQVDQQDSEDEGPPPRWDLKHQPEPKLQAEFPEIPQLGHVEVQDVQKDAQNEDGPPLQSQAPPSHPLELVASDIQVEEQDSEDEGPPPGWDSKRQPEPRLQMAHPVSPKSDIKMEDVKQDAQSECSQPRSDVHPSPPPEVVSSDIKVDQPDLENEGPPPGRDLQCLPEPNPTTSQSDIATEDVQLDARNEVSPQAQSYADPSPAPELVQSDIQVEQDSEDEGPPPGWDSKCEPEPKLKVESPIIPQPDTKTEDVQQYSRNEDGPKPQSLSHPSPAPELPIADTKTEDVHQYSQNEDGFIAQSVSYSSPAPELTISDTKTEDLQQYSQNEDGFIAQSLSHPSPAPEVAISDTKVEEQDSEDDGPPPGWDSKCHPEPKFQSSCPTNHPSNMNTEDDQQNAQDDEGPPPGWESTPRESQAHLCLPSPVVQSGMEFEHKTAKIVEEIPQPSSRKRSITPIKQQSSMPKRRRSMDDPGPEMGQMVCGSCRLLLSYPRGARYVECACCLEENYVLEEHEVGQVVCGACDVLLMYPYGAPKVRCVNCSIETEIRDHNHRPPLSEHKRRARQHLRRVQAG